MNQPLQKPPILTISQLTNAIKLSLEATFPSIWLQGEVSNFKQQTSGHLYFSLKDSKSQISAVMFRGETTTMRAPPKDGDNVIVFGDLNVYPPSGKYQIVVRELRLVGIGELLLKLEELKIKLHKRGWFRSEHKKPLPKFPKRIGVVTSPTGAAIQDILNILTRRFSGFHLILNPVRVQGEGAAQDIARAIEEFNRYGLVDVMIVGRGGGSIEDLWAFNEEVVAEAIFNSRIPIISAVGHETDHCIADYVADVRAPTPSAAAEIVIAEKSQQLNYLLQRKQRLQQTIGYILKNYRQRLTAIQKQPVISSPFMLLGSWIQKLDGYRQDIDLSVNRLIRHHRMLIETRQRQALALKPTTQLLHFKQKLMQSRKAIDIALMSKISLMRRALTQKSDFLKGQWMSRQEQRRRLFAASIKQKQLDVISRRLLIQRKERLEKVSAALHSINPKNLLTKGYCILFAENDRSVITSVGAVAKEQEIRVVLSDGAIISTIKEVYST